MKNILLTACLITSFLNVFSQEAWTAADDKIYGSKAEKQHQDMISHTSDNQFLCRYIGFKEFYTNELSEFLQSNRAYSVDDTYNKPGYLIFKMSRSGVYLGTGVPKLYIIYGINKDDRITSVKVTGPFADLAFLFMQYWPQDATWATENQLKPGVSAIKHCYGDLVAFKWNGSIPYITVTKDPNINVPIKQDTIIRANY